jgi:hypothetical protein
LVSYRNVVGDDEVEEIEIEIIVVKTSTHKSVVVPRRSQYSHVGLWNKVSGRGVSFQSISVGDNNIISSIQDKIYKCRYEE